MPLIQDRSLFDNPIRVFGKITSLQLQRARDRLRIVINRMDLCTQPARRQAEQSASGTRVQEAFPAERPQHFLERPLRRRDPLVVQQREKSRPIVAELEAFAGGYFGSMLNAHRTLHYKKIGPLSA